MSAALLLAAGLGGGVVAAAPVAGGAPPATLADADEAIARRCLDLRTRDPAAALAVAGEALAELARRPADPATATAVAAYEIKLQACVGRAAAVTGDGDRAAASAARIDVLLASHPMPPEFALRALSNAGASLHQAGRVHEALDFYLRTLEVARQDEADIAQVSALVNVGSIHSEELGAYEEAERFYLRAQSLDVGAADQRAVLAYNRGLNFLRMGRETEAADLFRAALARADESGHEVVGDRSRAELLALGAMEPPPADTTAELVGLARAQADGDPAGAATTWVRLSERALAAGDAEAALAHATAAGAAAAEGNFRPEQRDALEAEVAALARLGAWRRALEGSERLRAMEVERLRALNLTGLAGLQARLQDARDARELERLQESHRLEALRESQDRRLRNSGLVVLGGLALLGGAFLAYQRRVNRRLQVLSTVDPLTALLNRRAAESRLQHPDFAVPPEGRCSVVYLVDVDHFKGHNDRRGHAAGDRILAAVAGRLRAACRPDDIVARWGGEEFLVGCRGLDPDKAQVVAERLRAAAAVPAGDGQDAPPLTVSIGFACLPPTGDGGRMGRWQDAVKLADRALYAAKHGGRDAWVGLWVRPGPAAEPAAVLQDPAAAAATGAADVFASRPPVSWPRAPG